MEEILENVLGLAMLAVPVLIVVGFIVSVWRSDRDEDAARKKKIEKRIKKQEKQNKIEGFNHAGKKLVKFQKALGARSFAVKCFVYIRSVLFAVGSLLAIYFCDAQIIGSNPNIFLFFGQLIALFLALTLALYLLSLVYFPVCKAIYYLIHKNDVFPYKSTAKKDSDTRKMFKAAEKSHKEARTLWSTWWHALYVKRSRVVKIITIVGCFAVAFLKGYFDKQSCIHGFFEKFNVFTDKLATEDIISLGLVAILFALAVYALTNLAFYYSDRLILLTQFRDSDVKRFERYKDKLYEYWRENDPKENERYWEEVHAHAREREAEERRRMNRYVGSDSSSSSGGGLTEAEAWHATNTMMGGNSIDTTGM